MKSMKKPCIGSTIASTLRCPQVWEKLAEDVEPLTGQRQPIRDAGQRSAVADEEHFTASILAGASQPSALIVVAPLRSRSLASRAAAIHGSARFR